jgi:putative transposase
MYPSDLTDKQWAALITHCPFLIEPAHRIQVVFADGAYNGRLLDWVRQMFQWTMIIVSRRHAGRFEVLPWRWLIERTFAWLGNARRLSKDYEVHPASSECLIQITMIAIMVRRLAAHPV